MRTSTGINRAVSRVVTHAHTAIPYYKKLFDQAGVIPSQIRTVDDLVHLPLTKRDVMATLSTSENTDPAVDLGGCFRHQTSGTTGESLTLYLHQNELKYRQFLLARVLWKIAHVVPPIRIVELGRVIRVGRHIVDRGILLTAIKPAGQASPANWLQWLEAYRPQIVQGFPTALEILAQFCEEQSIHPPQPRVVVSRGEMLFPEVRQRIERVFRTRVFDLYNCQEVGNVAWQCPRNPSLMHINSDACVVEVVDEQGDRVANGKAGLLVLTNLYNYTMPFIRYVIGDRGRLLPDGPARCACGSRAPRMALLDGRADDMLLLPDGRRISPRVAATVLFWCRPDGTRINGIHRYQLIQETIDRLILRIVIGNDVDSDWRETLATTAREALGGLQLDIQEISAIPLESSGKYKRVISRI